MIFSESFTKVASELFELFWCKSWSQYFLKKSPPVNPCKFFFFNGSQNWVHLPIFYILWLCPTWQYSSFMGLKSIKEVHNSVSEWICHMIFRLRVDNWTRGVQLIEAASDSCLFIFALHESFLVVIFDIFEGAKMAPIMWESLFMRLCT